MNKEDFIKKLEALISGVWYISESEHPFTINMFDNVSINEVANKIAEQNTVSKDQVKLVDANAFFSKLERVIDPTDKLIVENSEKIKTLFSFLKKSLSDISVYRIEGNVKVPMYIIGVLSDNNCIGVETFSIES